MSVKVMVPFTLADDWSNGKNKWEYWCFEHCTGYYYGRRWDTDKMWDKDKTVWIFEKSEDATHFLLVWG